MNGKNIRKKRKIGSKRLFPQWLPRPTSVLDLHGDTILLIIDIMRKRSSQGGENERWREAFAEIRPSPLVTHQGRNDDVCFLTCILKRVPLPPPLSGLTCIYTDGPIAWASRSQARPVGTAVRGGRRISCGYLLHSRPNLPGYC